MVGRCPTLPPTVVTAVATNSCHHTSRITLPTSTRAMTTYDVDPDANFRFVLDELLRMKGHAVVMSLIECAKDILVNDMFRTGLLDILDMSRDIFKCRGA